jgi:hypothetical protein
MKNRLLLLLLLLVSVLNVPAQGLQNHIPAYAQYVITLNAQSYSGKADMNEVSKMDFFKAMKTEDKEIPVSSFISSLLGKPTEAGVQILPQAYIYRIDHDTVAGWCYLVSLSNADAFGKFLEQSFSKEGKSEGIQKSNGYSHFQQGLLSAGWTNDYALILVRDSYIPYSYVDYAEEAATAAKTQAELDSIQAVEMARLQMVTDSILKAEAEASKKKPAKKTVSPKNKDSKHPNDKVIIQEGEDQENKEEEARIADSLAAVADTQSGDFSNNGNKDWQKMENDRQNFAAKKMDKRCAQRLYDLMNLGTDQSINSLRAFKEAQKEKFDVEVWMNYSSDAFPSLNPMSSRKYRPAGAVQDTLGGGLAKLTKDNYSVAYCNFEKGAINIRHSFYVNPEMDDLVKDIYKKKINKNFFKYIKGENLMGYASMSVNVEQTIKASRKILVKTYEATMGSDARYITGMMDITSVFTNDDVVYNLFKGDFVLAVTDLKPFKTSYLSYEYDDNFNRTETKQEKTQVLPEFVAMASVGRPEEMQKILKAIEHMGGIKEEGKNTWLILIPGKFGFKVYLALENNILFCTNNEELVHGKLQSGYSKKEQMTSDQRAFMNSASVSYYWNGTKTFDLVSKQPEFKSSDKVMRNLNLLKDNIHDAKLSGVSHQNGCYTTTATVSFADSSVNSLFGIFKIVNSFYLIDK